MKKIIFWFVTLVMVSGFGVAMFVVVPFMAPPQHDPDDVIIIDVSPGKSFRQVARELESERVLTDMRKFLVLVRILGRSHDLKVGEYRLERFP